MRTNKRSFYISRMRLIDVDLKIRRNCEKPEKVTKYFSRPLYPRGSLFLNFRGIPSPFATTLCSFSIFCIRFETTSISRTNRSCKPSQPSSKKLFSITIMSGTKKKYRKGNRRRTQIGELKESWKLKRMSLIQIAAEWIIAKLKTNIA